MTTALLLRRWASDAGGTTAIEYALIAGLVAAVVAGALGGVRQVVSQLWGTVAALPF